MITHSAAICACEKAKYPVWALGLLANRLQSGLELDAFTYNAAISAYARAKRPDKTLDPRRWCNRKAESQT